MSEEISVLKLMDGTTIVGKVSSSGDIIEIESNGAGHQHHPRRAVVGGFMT